MAAVRGLFARLLQLLLTAWHATLTVWRLALQWVNGYVLYPEYGGRPATDFYHKAVLIGDGLAQGFGAWISLGAASGPMRYLNEAVRRAPALKMEWVFFERGRLNSTTQDWLPAGAAVAGEQEEEEESKEEVEQQPQGQAAASSLLDAVVTSRSGRDVCLVVVLLGLQDILQIKDPAVLLNLAAAGDEDSKANKKKLTTAPLVHHLKAIATHLLVQPQAPHVCLCTLPTVGAPSSIRARAIRGVNAQITRMVAGLKQEKAGWEGRVSLVDLSQRRVSRAEGRAFDGVHFTSTGYKALADALMEEVSTPMAKHEWAILQEYVTGRKRREVPEKKGWMGGWFGGGGKQKLN